MREMTPHQRQLVEALCDPARYPHAARRVRLVETHISWVLLAGRYAYKIKKALDLGFLDFTTLARRRFYCEEEIRLNRRLAPQLYLDVVAIGGSPQSPVLGEDDPAIEYAVRMRRFAASKQMDRQLALALVTPTHIDRLATLIARFHAGLPTAPQDSPFGTPREIQAPARQNFDQLAPLLEPADLALLERLRAAIEGEYAACAPWMERRRREGWVRECHGDLHLGNIVLIRGQPTPFDGIEFNPALRWIDVMSEVAFLVMDLLDRSRPDLAFRFLNGYLELTGDYAGVNLLRFYLAYRAMVRAKISAIFARQRDTRPEPAGRAMAACHGYLALASKCLAPQRPALIITHGLPGSGKTTVAQAALERLQAVRIRSDVERKRLFGLAPLERSRSGVGDGIYSAEGTQRTYARLHQLARDLLTAGFPVIVDAAFLRQAEREQFRQLACEMGLPFVMLNIRSAPAILRQRILQRMTRAKDASEADLQVLQVLQAAQEPLMPEELACTVDFLDGDMTGNEASWSALKKLTAPQDPSQ
ncbi:zeta toxin [mine drainage metagenome]|uniref:Zeta toxin n=1 Tax=mine drainage metagenome TaxID=410659 RepID=A0A1J5QAS9_9ZZZZ